jgi:hypothetical protein
MPKYRVYGKVIGTKYLGTFEADNEQEAIEKGLDSDDVSITLYHSYEDQVDGLEVEDARVDLVEGE